MSSLLETSLASVEMKDVNSSEGSTITLQTQVESNSIVKVYLFELDGDNYLIVARESWIDIYLLYEDDNHLSKACSIKSDLQIVDFIFDNFNIYALCSDGSLLLTTLSYHQDANIFTFSSWNQLSNSSSNFPVKLLRYHDTIVIVYIENEIQFVNLSNGKTFTYRYSGVHFDSCVLGDCLYMCINSSLVYKMKFNEECNLVESEMIKSPFEIISLHTTESRVIAITTSSIILDIETLDQLLKVETDQFISDYNYLLHKGYLCTEHGDVYSIDGNQAKLIYTKLGIEKICKSTQESNFLIGYSSVSDLIYIPLEESMTDLQPRSLLPNISYVTDFDKKGDDFIIATPKRLCSVKKGMSCRVTSLTDESYDGIDNVFTPTTGFIILSFVNQSKVLRISEESIDECNNNVFESSRATFYCDQILDSFILQVTATELRLMDLQLRTLLSSIKINSTVITSKGNNIYVSYENKITKFEVSQEGQMTESFSIYLDRDISSMRATENNHLIASTYSGIIYFITGQNISKTIDINSQQIETNIVESIFYTGRLLLLGLRDGHLLVYDLDQLVKKFKLGNVPVQLRESFDDIIIALSNNCYYISVDSMNLNISNLLVNDQILSVQNFNVSGYENSLLCLSSDSKIKVISIETTNFQPMIKEIYSEEDCQRVHVTEDNSIIYVCNNYSTLRYIDDNKETLTLYSFPPSEKIYSIISFKVKNEDSHDSNFIIVGTKYTRHHNNIIMNRDPTTLSHGLLHVLKLGKVSDVYKCEHVGSCELPYMVYAMKQYSNEHLLVAYGERLGLFFFDQKEMKLVDQANVRHFVNSIDICDNLICITDRFDGLLFYTIHEGKFFYLTNVSLRLDALNSATCRFINSKTVASIDRSHQLIIWKINNVNTSTHTISLSKQKQFDTKELALKVMPISNNQLFYITLNGSINFLNMEE